MRLWHKDLIPVLPRQQLLGQWRELCLIAKNISEKGTPGHILVNKIVDYPPDHFEAYALRVVSEMVNRGYRVNYRKFSKYLPDLYFDSYPKHAEIFAGWHNNRYLIQCYFNLQEKYDCRGISPEDWQLIEQYVERRKPMDTLMAFAMGEAHRDCELMVFDWDHAAELIRESDASYAAAGLRSDWDWTGGIIYENGKIIDDTYTYLASTWAVPELALDEELHPCYRMQSETPGWDAHTKWPESAVKILTTPFIHFKMRMQIEEIYLAWCKENKIADKPNSMVVFMLEKGWLNEWKISDDLKGED